MSPIVGEAGELVWECFLLPGEHALRLLLEVAPGLAGAAGLGAIEPEGMAVRIASGVFWLAVLWISFRLWTWARRIDKALTAWFADRYGEMRRSLRVARRFAICTLRRIWRRPPRLEPSSAQKVELGALELALLRAQLLVVPGSSIAARDLAVGLRVSAGQVRQPLRRLSALGLVEVDHESGAEGYRLTSYGRLFVGSLATRRAAIAGR